MSARLLIIRHGETPANLDATWHGATDTPLTARGREQAKRVAKKVTQVTQLGEVAALYTSPLVRARDTAAAIGRACGLSATVIDDLREYGVGRFEGMRFRDLHERYRIWEQMKLDPDYAPHGGETPGAVAERIVGALQGIARDHRGESVVVVSHGGVLSMAFAQILDGVYWKWDRVVDNCSLSELGLDAAGAGELRRFNDIEHLQGLAGPELGDLTGS